MLQLIVNHEYDINITIYDADDHVIHPSDNILTKTTFGKQFDVIDISVGTKYSHWKIIGFHFDLTLSGEWPVGSCESSDSWNRQDQGKAIFCQFDPCAMAQFCDPCEMKLSTIAGKP